MNAPLIVHPSEYASNLQRELAYQSAVFTVLLATTRPKGTRRGQPMLSADEVAAMDLAMSMGLSPEGFAARIVAADKKAGVGAVPPVDADEPPSDTEILERLIARNCLGAVRHYDGSGWSWNTTIYPSARAALAAFMKATG
jgi:hypothetical protein